MKIGHRMADRCWCQDRCLGLLRLVIRHDRGGWWAVTLTVKVIASGRQARFGESVEFGGHTSGLGRTDPMEDLPGLPQSVLGAGGVARGQRAAAEAGECLGLITGAADLASQLESRPVPTLVRVPVTAH